MKKISVIVPIYNSEDYIDRCVRSIVEQSYKNIEIILVDDGSTDNSSMMCDEWAKNDKRVKVIHKENGGVSSARNEGLKIAKGDYISFVDSDDYIDKKMIEKMLNQMEKGNTDLVICNYEPNSNYNTNKLISKNDFYNLILDKTLFRGYLWNKLYKKEIISKNNLKLDSKIHICEDLLFNCEYALYCNDIRVINDKLYYYSDDSYSVLNKPLNERFLSVVDAYEKLLDIYSKNGYSQEELKVCYLKAIVDIIYRNKLVKNKYDLSQLKERKKQLYKEINKKSFSFKKRIELFLYNYFPILIGIARRKFRRRKK